MARGEIRWKTWQLVATAALALMLGAAAGASSSSSDREALEEAERKATAAQTLVDDMTSKAGTLSGDLDRALRATSTLPLPTTATTSPPTTRAPATTAPTTTEPPGPKTTFGGEGTYRVGADIAPGTYRTAGPKPSSSFPLCYWERQSDLSGTFGAIIANENLQGPGVVTIAASDKGFKTSGCQTWSQV